MSNIIGEKARLVVYRIVTYLAVAYRIIVIHPYHLSPSLVGYSADQ